MEKKETNGNWHGMAWHGIRNTNTHKRHRNYEEMLANFIL